MGEQILEKIRQHKANKNVNYVITFGNMTEPVNN